MKFKKMENLQELKLTELSNSEKQTINGGLAPLVIAGIAVAGISIGYTFSRWWNRK